MASSSTCPRQGILKEMGRLKHPRRQSSTASRNPSPTRRENGQTNSPDVYGHIAPPKDEQPVRLLSLWHLVWKQSFLLTLSCLSIYTLLPSIKQNSKKMAASLDLAKKKREQTITNIAAYQQQLFSSYNKMAKIGQFQPGDLVLRKSLITTRREGFKKMDPIWEGSYKISRVGSKGNYTLATMNDKEIEKQ
ncbi:hypothetical protein ACFXTO_041171 [Malus domestica]